MRAEQASAVADQRTAQRTLLDPQATAAEKMAAQDALGAAQARGNKAGQHAQLMEKKGDTADSASDSRSRKEAFDKARLKVSRYETQGTYATAADAARAEIQMKEAIAAAKSSRLFATKAERNQAVADRTAEIEKLRQGGDAPPEDIEPELSPLDVNVELNRMADRLNAEIQATDAGARAAALQLKQFEAGSSDLGFGVRVMNSFTQRAAAAIVFVNLSLGVAQGQNAAPIDLTADPAVARSVVSDAETAASMTFGDFMDLARAEREAAAGSHASLMERASDRAEVKTKEQTDLRNKAEDIQKRIEALNDKFKQGNFTAADLAELDVLAREAKRIQNQEGPSKESLNDQIKGARERAGDIALTLSKYDIQQRLSRAFDASENAIQVSNAQCVRPKRERMRPDRVKTPHKPEIRFPRRGQNSEPRLMISVPTGLPAKRIRFSWTR